jgi:hypothetical protein
MQRTATADFVPPQKNTAVDRTNAALMFTQCGISGKLSLRQHFKQVLASIRKSNFLWILDWIDN